LDVHVASIHAQSDQTYGRVRIAKQLRRSGQVVGHERIRQSLLRQALRPVYKRPYRVTTDSEHDKPIAPNVLKRRFDGWQPNQAWVADVTYIHRRQGWLYLAVVLDLATRRIVGWSMSERMKAGLVCDALTMAYQHRHPGVGLIMHTDRGSQYASKKYRKLISDYGMTPSMSRKANCWAANNALWTIAMVRMRSDPRTRIYVARRTNEGLTLKEIHRCLKRYIVRELYPLILRDLEAVTTDP
jgi:putative transposase